MSPVSDRFILGRLAFGPGPEDERAHLREAGLGQWLKEQLAAPAGDDPLTLQRLGQARLRIAYPAGTLPGQEYPALDEERPLETLGSPSKRCGSAPPAPVRGPTSSEPGEKRCGELLAKLETLR